MAAAGDPKVFNDTAKWINVAASECAEFCVQNFVGLVPSCHRI